MADPTSRRQARQSGQTHYFTGRPCHKGHIAKRFAISGNCFQCLRESNPDRHERYGQAPERKRYEREYYQRVKERVRANQIRRQFGLSLNEYDELLIAQGGTCAICQTPPENKRLGVDHCHTTGVVRGLLCDSCNGAIGLLKDEPRLLHKAIMHLERFKKDQ